jgi:hypothetical protein
MKGKTARGRTYQRKFDWADAQRRRARGESYSSIARSYGVTPQAVKLACDPEERERAAQRARAFLAIGTAHCIDCGAPITRYRKRCIACAHLQLATTVREGELLCVDCKQWKPDEEFPRNAQLKARRGRHRQCRACNTIARREYRHRNPEAERTYAREYKRRRRAAK